MFEAGPVNTEHYDPTDYEANQADVRSTIHELFSQAGNIEAYQNKVYRELFPNVEGRKQSGNPLMKVARAAFYENVSRTAFAKTASSLQIEAAFRSFVNELDLISSSRR